MRRRFLFGGASLLAGALVVLPAAAGSETSPTITAENLSGLYGESHVWTPSQVVLAGGGAVALSNPTAVRHGVRWIGAPAPPSCSGVPVGTTEADSATQWSGTCTFATPGTYRFYCTVHGAAMSGTVIVSGPATTGTSSQPATPGGSTPSAPGAGEPVVSLTGSGVAGSPLAGSAAKAIRLAASQRGRSVRGSLKISQAGAHGRLEVDLLSSNASLARAAGGALAHVGRFVRSSLSPGTVSFAVPLSKRATAALRRNGRLALTVRLSLKPLAGAAVRISRAVLLHR